MRMITGAILLLTAEQAFAHSQLVPFPNQVFASEVLYPASMILSVLGVAFVIWGAICDRDRESNKT